MDFVFVLGTIVTVMLVSFAVQVVVLYCIVNVISFLFGLSMTITFFQSIGVVLIYKLIRWIM